MHTKYVRILMDHVYICAIYLHDTKLVNEENRSKK